MSASFLCAGGSHNTLTWRDSMTQHGGEMTKAKSILNTTGAAKSQRI